MVRAAVPVAAVDEYGDTRPAEHHVCLAPKARGGRLVDSVAKALPMEQSPHSKLGKGVPARMSRHSCGHAFRCRPRIEGHHHPRPRLVVIATAPTPCRATARRRSQGELPRGLGDSTLSTPAGVGRVHVKYLLPG